MSRRERAARNTKAFVDAFVQVCWEARGAILVLIALLWIYIFARVLFF